MIWQRLRRDLVDAMNTHDFFNEVGLAFDVATPAWHARLDDLAIAFNAKTKTLQDIERGIIRHFDAGQAFDFCNREINDACLIGLVTNHVENCRLTAAEFEHESGCNFRTRDHHFRIDATLKTIARIRDDTEFAARAGNHARVPESRFDQHIDGVFVTT